MIGDQGDMQARLRAMLPTHWFADDAPNLSALLAGLGSVWAWLYSLLAYVQSQARISTATDGWLDLVAFDYGGTAWARLTDESDDAYRRRIRWNLQRQRGTRASVIANVSALTGRAPMVFEPAYPPDTGGYNTPSLAWNYQGGWGSLSLPYQCFVTAFRPKGGGIANIGGWGSAKTTLALGGWNTGALAWGDASLIEGNVSDDQILATVAASMPAASIAWTTLSN